MQKTKEVLSALVDYEALSAVRALNPPKIEKIKIPEYIKSLNFEKASSKFDQKMERVKKKISSIEQDVETQKEIMARAKRETSHLFGPPKDPSLIARHNDWVDRGRLAAEKHDDLIDKYNEATEEAKEQLAELEREALVVIDDDIVAALQKVGQAAGKLANSANASDELAALEACFIGLKIYAFFVDHIDGNAARKEAQSANAELVTLFAKLCGGDGGGNHIIDRFQRHLYLVQNNGTLYQQLVALLATSDQENLRSNATRLEALVSKKFDVAFKYQGVVDPSELEAISANVRTAIRDLDHHRAQLEQQASNSAEIAQTAVTIQQAADALVVSLREGVTGFQGGPLGPTDFLCEIVDQETIDDFFAKDVKPAVVALRQLLAESLGEPELDRILTDTYDVHFLARADKAVAEAALMKLEQLRKQAPAAMAAAASLKKGLEEDLVKISEVPQENAERFTADVGMKYMLSFVPVIGPLLAGAVLMQIDGFKAGFRSSNDIYRKLAGETAAKNQKMMMVHAALGGAAALVALVMAITDGSWLVAAGVGAVAYLLTAFLLFIAGRRLDGYNAASSSESRGQSSVAV